MSNDSAFEMATSNIRYGQGVTSEVGMEIADRGIKHVFVVVDPHLAQLPIVTDALKALEE